MGDADRSEAALLAGGALVICAAAISGWALRRLVQGR
jgi:hypothetical protein